MLDMGIKNIILVICCFNIGISCKSKEYKIDTFYYLQLDKTIKIKIDKRFDLLFSEKLDLDSAYSIELRYRDNSDIKILHKIYNREIYPKNKDNMLAYTNVNIRCKKLNKNQAVQKVLMCKNYYINNIPIFCSGTIFKSPEDVIEYSSSYIDLIDTSHVIITTVAFTNSMLDLKDIEKKHFDFLNNVKIIKGKVAI